MTLNEEQLRFFYNEVLGLMEWDEEVEASGIDPLQFVRDEVDELRRRIRRMRAAADFGHSHSTEVITTSVDTLCQCTHDVYEDILKPGHCTQCGGWLKNVFDTPDDREDSNPLYF